MAKDRLSLGLGDQHVDRLHHGGVGISLVGALREELQLPEGDGVAALQDTDVVVTHIVPHHVGDAGVAAAGCTHPEDVVVAPLDIQGVIIHQEVDDLVRVGTSVKQVTDDMEMIHCEALDQIRQCLNELIAVLDPDDGVQDALVICLLVVPFIRKRMEQLVDYVGELLRHGFSHFGAGVLG